MANRRRGLVTHSRPSTRGTIITMSGRLDDASSPMAAWYLDSEIDAARGDVIFDLHCLDVAAPSGVQLLVRARRNLAVQGRRAIFEGLFGGAERELAALPVH
jgi:hypothetical protein